MSKLLQFVKMHGAGNDFIMIDGYTEDTAVLTNSTIRDLCDRRKGIAADGLIVIAPSSASDASFRMLYYNNDGFEAEMCGNGARCSVAYAHQLKLIGKLCQFETWHGLLSGQIMDDSTVEVSLPAWFDLDMDLALPESQWSEHYYVNTGVPHLVIPVDDVSGVLPGTL